MRGRMPGSFEYINRGREEQERCDLTGDNKTACSSSARNAEAEKKRQDTLAARYIGSDSTLLLQQC
jgi:hypothetical protein